MKRLALTLAVLVSLTGNVLAAVTSLRGDALSPINPNPMPGVPSLLDMIKQQDLIAYGNDLWFEKSFAGQWKRAGCTVEDRSEPMARVICPGFRINPKVANEDGAAQFFIDDLLPPQPEKVKTFRENDPGLIGGI